MKDYDVVGIERRTIRVELDVGLLRSNSALQCCGC
jgi:hypothetical protein